METDSLKAFLSVAEEGSFSEAAEQLHLTQPAVSKRIAVLENLLDTRLFDRIGRQVSLTEAGRALLPRARQILQQIDDTRRAIHDLRGEVSGRLSLITSHHVGLHRLPPVLRAFTERFPGVELDIDFLDSEQAYDAVLHGHVDVAVVTLAPQGHNKIYCQAVWSDPLLWVVGRSHPLAARQGLSLQELAGHAAILPKRSTYTGALVAQLFEDRKLELRCSLNTNYLETVKMMVSIGLGWSCLPATLVDEQLAVLDVEGLLVERQLGAIYHKERSLSNAVRSFLALLQARA